MEGIIFNPGLKSHTMSYDTGGVPLHHADTTAMFERTFKEHFKGLHSYAISIVKDEDEAEEIVQQVFYKLWEKRDTIPTLGSINAYLYRAVYNESINYIRHQKVKAAHQAHAAHTMGDGGIKPGRTSITELEKKLELALNELPEKCRTVFQMSRFEELKYHEIAARLDISVKTVENHMGKALKLLRISLADYLPVLWFILFNLQIGIS